MSIKILPDCMMPDGATPCRGYLELQTENQVLHAELEAMRDRLGSLGSHNLKQGMMLAQMGVEPEGLAKVSINKIKADAIRGLISDMQPYLLEEDDGTLILLYENLLEHANQVEKGQ